MSNGDRLPRRELPDLPPIPSGLSDVLERAARDRTFRQGLLSDRDAALNAAGIALSARELAILGAIPPAQLGAMIARFTVLGGERRKFLEQAAATAVTVLGGAALTAFQASCKKKPTRAENADMKEGGGHRPQLDDGYRPGDPPPKRDAPKCPLTLSIGEFKTLSGPERAPGKVDRDRLQEQLERICESLGVKQPGKVTYEFDVTADGAVSNVKALDNSIQPPDFDVLTRRQLERLVLFGNAPSRVSVVVELR